MIAETELSITKSCVTLELPRSTFYKRKNVVAKKEHDHALRKEMHTIALEFPGYGYRRIHAELHRRQKNVNRKKILRIMREEHILCKRKSFKPQTTNSNHNLPLYPNLTRNLVVTKRNQLWVADITYIAIEDGWIYLAAIMDVYSRKCIGWELNRRMDAIMALNALDMAIEQRAPLGFAELIHHSDRGVQYASHAYVARLQALSIKISMTETGNPRENAYAESFFKTIKVEEVYLKDYRTFEEAFTNIHQFIEDVYNAKRLHSSIGYKPPNEMEAEVLNIR
jgi:putative transposase